jgi:hypothetical protein
MFAQGWALPLHASFISLDKLAHGSSGLMSLQWRRYSQVTCVFPHQDHGLCRLQWLQAHDGELHLCVTPFLRVLL